MSCWWCRWYTIVCILFFPINAIKMWVRNILLVRVNNYYCPFSYSICVTTVITEKKQQMRRAPIVERKKNLENIEYRPDGRWFLWIRHITISKFHYYTFIFCSIQFRSNIISCKFDFYCNCQHLRTMKKDFIFAI